MMSVLEAVVVEAGKVFVVEEVVYLADELKLLMVNKVIILMKMIFKTITKIVKVLLEIEVKVLIEMEFKAVVVVKVGMVLV